jgi:DNA-directed RNA polymerase specialized sigma24 family protein
MALTSRSHVGLYEVLSAIGAIGMGEVYRARDARLGRDVARKVLPEAFALADLDPRQRRLIERRFFGELSIEETAVGMGISSRMVDRAWVAARAWIRLELKKDATK